MPSSEIRTPAPALLPEYLNIKQASVYLGCTVSAVRQMMVYSKAVPYVRLGKRIIFKRVDLDEFMAAQKVAA